MQATRLLLAAASLILLSPPAVQGQSAPLPDRQFLDRFGLERVWWSQAELNPTRDTVLHLSLDEELLYVQSTGNAVTAFDNLTGEKKWAIQLGRPDTPAFPVVSNQNVALVASGLFMYAVDKWTGKETWRIRLDEAASTSPAMDDTQVYVGTLSGSVYAYNLEKIHELYAEGLLPQWSYQSQVWRYKTAHEITTPPISNGRVLTFASRDKSLYAVSTLKRSPLYQLELNKEISAPIAAADGFLYFASQDYNFYCMRQENGSILWEFVSGHAVTEPPVVIGDQVFLTPNEDGMYCLSQITGKNIWWRPKIEAFVARTPKIVYTTDSTGHLVLIDRLTGGLLGALPLQAYPLRVTNDRTDRLYMATKSGLVISLNEKGRQFPIYYKHPDRKPLLPEFAPEGGDPVEPTEPEPTETN